MVKKFTTLLRKQYSGIHEAALLLGIFSLISQILGLVRDRALVSNLGPSLELDVYYAAFRIPDFIFTALASLVAVTAIMPFLVEKLQGKDVETARIFLDKVFSGFLFAMTIVYLGIFVAMPYLSHLVAPGFSPEGQTLLVTMSRIMLLSPLLLGIQNILGSVVQLHKKFFIYALAPVLYNVGILIGVYVFYPLVGVYGLAFGVVFGAFLHLGISVPTVFELGFLPRVTTHIDWRELWRIAKIAFPRTLTLSMNTLIALILTAVASSFAYGSVSILAFALNLQSIPIMMISVSYAVAAFPNLVELFAQGKREQFLQTVSDTARQIIFWSLPIMTLFIVLRAHIVRVVYGTNTLNWNDTRLTAALFAILSLAILSHSLSLVFTRAYYASGKTKKPFMIMVVGGVVTCAFVFICLRVGNVSSEVVAFVRSLLRLEGVTNASLVILGVAYVLGQFVNTVLFIISFRRDFGSGIIRSLARTFFVSLTGAAMLGIATYGGLVLVDPFFSSDTFIGVFGQGLFAGVCGIAVALMTLRLFKSQELQMMSNTLHAKFWRADVISPGHENYE